MLILLSALLSTLRSMFRSRAVLELENMALRHQIGVLKRSARKRPKLTPIDRLFWVFLSQVWGNWRSALDIVKPATAIAWHSRDFVSSGPGRSDMAGWVGPVCPARSAI